MKKVCKIIIIIIISLVIIWAILNKFLFQFPVIKDSTQASDLKINKWYKINTSGKSSDGSDWYGYVKKGKENKVMVYFHGGGVSINNETANGDFYNKKLWGNDWFTNTVTNIGIGSTSKENPFKDWTVFVISYSTGDFHVGAGEYNYTDEKGNKKVLYHDGYNNYKEFMDKATKLFNTPDELLVTGFSAGGFGTSLLSNDILTNYYSDVPNTTVLVDSSLLLYNDWNNVAKDVWKAPKEISDRLTSDNITLDSLIALSNDHPNTKILFDSSIRDGELAKYQNYLDNGKLEVNKEYGKVYQNNLKNMISGIKQNIPNSAIYIWDGIEYAEQDKDLTLHTIIGIPHSYKEKFGNNKTIAEWTMDAVNGNLKDYGIDLLSK